MLRKFRRKRARVPLTLVKGKRISLLHADGGFSVDEVCGLTSFQRCVGYRAFQSWLCLLASRISPAIVPAFLHILRLESVWVYLVSLSKSGE